MPLEAFFGTIDKPLNRSEIVFAKKICQACPVLMDCAVFSLQGHESGPDPYGVWAGSTPHDRARTLRQHNGDVVMSARYLVTQTLYMDSERTA